MFEVCIRECIFRTAGGSVRVQRRAAFYCYHNNTWKNYFILKLDSFCQNMPNTLDLLILKSYEGTL